MSSTRAPSRGRSQKRRAVPSEEQLVFSFLAPSQPEPSNEQTSLESTRESTRESALDELIPRKLSLEDLSSTHIGEVERLAWELGFEHLVGVDEAGRGPWAGPVVAAAVLLPPNAALPPALRSLNDSKQLNEAQREALFEPIISYALATGVGVATPQQIDQVNILQATFYAMRAALCELWQSAPRALHQASSKSPKSALLLIDGKAPLPLQQEELTAEEQLNAEVLSCLASLNAHPQRSLIKGDARSLSIAAASVLAKVTRDRFMVTEAARFPGYGFERHKGYGTAQHQEALRRLGPCESHRLSFKPIKALLIPSQEP